MSTILDIIEEIQWKLYLIFSLKEWWQMNQKESETMRPKRLYLQKYLTFAWDKYNDGKIVKAGIERCNKAGIQCKHMQFFVLIGFDSTPDQDMERVMTLRELGCMPFVMPYNKSNPYQAAFTRWVNHRATFKSCSWSDYKYKSKMETPAVACP
jgi:hypothetical protein